MENIWKYEGEKTVSVSNISVFEDWDGYCSVTVKHDSDWLYTDSGFEKAISKELGFNVYFSDWRLQKDGEAHLEGFIY